MSGRVHQEDHDKLKCLSRILVNTAKDGTGTYLYLLVDSDGHLQVDVLSSALPTDAATETTLSDIDGSLDNIEADADAAATHLANIHNSLDAIEEAVSREDAPHANRDYGICVFAVRKDTAAALAGADGDYIPFITDENGKLWVNPGVEQVGSLATALTDLDQVYDADPTTDVSAVVDADGYRYASLSYEIDVALTPTDILFEVEVSLDGTNYIKLMYDFLGDLRYTDTAVGTGVEETLSFPIACSKIRVRVTCTGTDATNTFTVDNCILYLRN